MSTKRVVAFYSDVSGEEVVGPDATLLFGSTARSEIELTLEEQVACRIVTGRFIVAAWARRPKPTDQISSDKPSRSPATHFAPWRSRMAFADTAKGKVPELVREADKASVARLGESTLE